MKIKTNFYTLTPYDNLLLIESFYSWDDRVTMGFAMDVSNLIRHHYQGKPWGILHDGRQWQLNTPDSKRKIEELVRSKITGTLTHHAFVTGKSEIKKWIVESIFNDINHYKARLFERIEDAEAWLDKAGFRRT